MSKKKSKKRARLRKQPTPIAGGVEPLTVPVNLAKRERSELEAVAVQVGQLSRNVDLTRNFIRSLENDLAAQRAHLATTMMNHQTAAQRLVELTALNQPVG